jgi:hypothetical protein
MRFSGLRPLTLLLLALAPASSFATPAHVVMIRHAEEPEEGTGLNTRGRERARALVGFFKSNSAMKRLGAPVALYAAAQRSEDTSNRSVETLRPLARALDLEINEDYTKKEYEEAAEEILEDEKYDGRTVVICWTHKQMAEFAEELGYEDPDEWDGDVYDRAWVLTFRGENVTLKDIPQNLLDGDSEE